MYTFIAHVLCIYLISDLLSGLLHWVEDNYFSENTFLLGELVIRPNIIHHYYPRYFTRFSWWHTSRDLVLIGLGIIALYYWLCGTLTWQLLLFVFITSNANYIHKCAHRSAKENGRVIYTLQRLGIILRPNNHNKHHTDPKQSYYCAVGNLLNPILEYIKFWRFLEHVIYTTSGISPRPDPSVRVNDIDTPEWVRPWYAKASKQIK